MNTITREEWGAVIVPDTRFTSRGGGSHDIVIHHTAESLAEAIRDQRAGPGKPGAKWFAARYKANRSVRKAIRAWEKSDQTAFAAECKAMRDHQAYHRNVKGWTDIGYHYVVFPSGRIHEGRPPWATGAHAGPSGNGMVGVSFAGNYETDKLTANQLVSLAALKEQHGSRLIGHYRVPGNSTACPGRNIKASLSL